MVKSYNIAPSTWEINLTLVSSCLRVCVQASCERQSMEFVSVLCARFFPRGELTASCVHERMVHAQRLMSCADHAWCTAPVSITTLQRKSPKRLLLGAFITIVDPLHLLPPALPLPRSAEFIISGPMVPRWRERIGRESGIAEHEVRVHALGRVHREVPPHPSSLLRWNQSIVPSTSTSGTTGRGTTAVMFLAPAALMFTAATRLLRQRRNNWHGGAWPWRHCASRQLASWCTTLLE